MKVTWFFVTTRPLTLAAIPFTSIGPAGRWGGAACCAEIPDPERMALETTRASARREFVEVMVVESADCGEHVRRAESFHSTRKLASGETPTEPNLNAASG